jgi:transcriptional regulator with XRE-family HTH domain
MEKFAQNLKKRAAELGISNAEVARRAGLSERRYGNYIVGRREPDLQTLVHIAEVLETTPDNLLGVNESEKQDLMLDKINSAVKSLSRSDKETVAAMIEGLANLRRK